MGVTDRVAVAERADVEPTLALRLDNVRREYGSGQRRIVAVDGVSLEVPEGQFVAVTGRSGSGKSTLLNLVAGIDTPTGGRIWVGGHEISRLSDDDLTRLRRERLGMIYQFFNLLSTLNVLENVMLPAMLAGEKERDVRDRSEALLESVGMSHRLTSLPHALSGGEMQRTAIARALIHGPTLVLADEPTGNLDSRSAETVLTVLRDLTREHGVTVLLVTHSGEAAAVAERRLEMRDGRVVADEGGR